jgi:hypothetical protein
VALVEIAELTEENDRLRRQLGLGVRHPMSERHDPTVDGDWPVVLRVPRSNGLPYADASSAAEDKLALFRALFAGRTDVYARRWVSSRTGRAGWSPAEEDPWDKTKPDTERMFFPLSDQVIFRHLSRPEPGQRELHVGLYPMLPDDTTWLLVCDFDDKDWRGDAAAYVAACAEIGIPALVEVSRSGAGAHAWTFFTAPVPAGLARALGMGVLRCTIDARGGTSLASDDRLIPAQDFVPIHSKRGARFGNLIALPLNGTCRMLGTTLFVDPATWEPYPDQFAYLSHAERLTPARVHELVDELGPMRAGPSPTAPVAPPRPRRGALGKAPAVVNTEVGAMLRVATAGLPPTLIAALTHAASFHNPEFYRRQNQRFSTFNTPRLVCCFDDTDPEWLALPRGLRDEAAALVAAASGTLKVTSAHDPPAPIEARFTGKLSAVQAEAVAAMASHPTGVLVAPPGTGKTVMACALIAHHALPQPLSSTALSCWPSGANA